MRGREGRGKGGLEVRTMNGSPADATDRHPKRLQRSQVNRSQRNLGIESKIFLQRLVCLSSDQLVCNSTEDHHLK